MSINFSVVLWTVINFVVLMAALNFVLFRPLMKFMRERDEKIKRGRDAGAGADEKINAAKADFEKQISDANAVREKNERQKQSDDKKAKDKALAAALQRLEDEQNAKLLALENSEKNQEKRLEARTEELAKLIADKMI